MHSVFVRIDDSEIIALANGIYDGKPETGGFG